jgi:hypothetical protein
LIGSSVKLITTTDTFINISEVQVFGIKIDTTPDVVRCRLPAIPTTYSNSEFKIEAATDNLNSGVYFGASSAKLAFDGSIYTAPTDNSN